MLSDERNELASVLQLMDGLADQWGDEAVFRRCRDRLRSLLTEPEPLVWEEARTFSNGIAEFRAPLERGYFRIVGEDSQWLLYTFDLRMNLTHSFPSLESAKQACEALRPFLEQIGGGE